MTKETISVGKKARTLAILIIHNFLRLAKALRALKDEAADLSLNVVELIGLNRPEERLRNGVWGLSSLAR